MLDILQPRLQNASSHEEKVHILREFLQIVVLKNLSDQGFFESTLFLGGTALRILHGVARYSEDLDFSVRRLDLYDFSASMQELVAQLALFNLPVDIRMKSGVVDSCMLRFTTVLQQCGLTKLADHKLSIKVEVDTRPPAGGVDVVRVLQDHFLFPVRAHDLPTLMAGKLHAILCRGFIKGRDYYDLLWYLTKKVEPNVVFLQNALEQTQGYVVSLPHSSWKELLRIHIEQVDFSIVLRDVAPFLMRPEEGRLLVREYFLGMLGEGD